MHCLSHGRKCHYNYDLYSWLDPSWIRHGWLPTDDVQQVMVPLELFVVVVVAAAAAGDIMLSLGGGLGFEAGLEVAWMLLLSVHRMMSLVDSGSIDESLLDLLRIALDATSCGAIYSLYQTASLTSDEVRKIVRSVRLMAARIIFSTLRSGEHITLSHSIII